MKKMWKRFVSLLLACTLLAGMLPLSASAAVSAPGEGSEQYKYAKGILDELNESIEGSESEYDLIGPASLGDSELYTYLLTRYYILEGTTEVIVDNQYVIVPGVDMTDGNMPDYDSSEDGQPWVSANASAVYIADGVTGIGSHAFNGMDTLEKVVFQDASKLTYVGSYAFSGDNKAQFTDEGNSNAGGDDPTRILDLSHVEKMGENAFYNCDGIKGVELSGSITAVETKEGGGTQEINNKIPNHAFESCNALTSITVPEGITTIGTAAFAGCTQADSITLPDSLVTIGDRAFMCSIDGANRSLTSLTIPENVKNIGASAFYGYKALATVTVESTELEKPGDAAFGDNEMSAYSGQQTVGGEVIENAGTIFKTPNANITELFVNYENCYLGPISPLTLIEEESYPAMCNKAGKNVYKYTYNNEEEKRLEETLSPLQPHFTETKTIPATCRQPAYYEKTCDQWFEKDKETGKWVQTTHIHNESIPVDGNDYEAPKGHAYEVTNISNSGHITDAGGSQVTFVCQNDCHDENRDGSQKTVNLTLTLTQQEATTLQKLSDITLPALINGTLEWNKPDTELDFDEDVQYFPVTFTPDPQQYNYLQNGGEAVKASKYGETQLLVGVKVEKVELDFSAIAFDNASVLLDTTSQEQVSISVTGAPTSGLDGDPTYRYYDDKDYDKDVPPARNQVWSGMVSVTYQYNSDDYWVDPNTEFIYGTDSEPYTIDVQSGSDGNGTVTISHRYQIIEGNWDAVSAVVMQRTYGDDDMNTVHLTGVPKGATIKWRYAPDGTESYTQWESQGMEETDGTVDIVPIQNAGDYDVEIEIIYSDYDPDKWNKTLSVHVYKKAVAIPTAVTGLTYTGEEQTGVSVAEDMGDIYTLSGNTGKDATGYTATATLADEAFPNYCWRGQQEGEKTAKISWSIAKRSVLLPTVSQTKTYQYNGEYQKIVSAPNGTNFEYVFPTEGTEVQGEFKESGIVAFTVTNGQAKDVGEYPIKATLTNGNYQWVGTGAPDDGSLSVDLGEWEITPIYLTAPAFTANGKAYDGQPYDPDTLVQWQDESRAQAVAKVQEKMKGSDQFTFSHFVYNPGATAPKDAGSYTVQAVYTYPTQNYVLQNNTSRNFIITQKSLTMQAPSDQKLTYTGASQEIRGVTVKAEGLVEGDYEDAYIIKYSSQEWDKTLNDGQGGWSSNTTSYNGLPSLEHVGRYLITAKLTSKNYTAADVTYQVEISIATQTVELTGEGLQGDGSEENPYTISKTLGNDPFTVTGKGYVGENATGAQITYKSSDSDTASVDENGQVTLKKATAKGESVTITVTAAGSANYQAATATYTITVGKGTPEVAVQMPTGGSADNTYSYTGEALTFNATVTGASNGAVAPTTDRKVTYNFYSDNSGQKGDALANQPTGIGTYWVEAVYEGDDNYNGLTSTAEKFTISPAALEVEATGYSHTYDGQKYYPVASIKVTGVGEKTFTKDDYTISYAKKTDDQPPEADDEWRADLQVKDVADSGDYWFKVVIKNDDSYNAYIGSVTVDIDPKQLTVTKTVKPTKEYDGTADADVQFDTIATEIPGESVTADSVSAVYDSPNANVDNFITITYQLTAGPNTDLDNYSVSTDGGEITEEGLGKETVKEVNGISVGIDPAPITVDIKDQEKVYDGSVATPSQSEWSVDEGKLYDVDDDGIKDNLGIALSIASGSKDAGTYAITGTANNSNYDVTFTGSWTGGTAGTYTITHRPISVQIGNAEGFYGDAPVLKGVELTYEGTDEENHRGLAPDENSVPNITLGTGASAQSPVAGYVIYAVDGSNGQIQKDTPVVIGNYNVTFTNEGTYTVKQRPITITIKDHSSKYGAEIDGGIADPVSDKDYTVAITAGNTVTGGAIVNGDDLGIALFTTAKKGDNAGTYPISGEAKAESSVVSNYAITWAGETSWNGSDQDSTTADSAKGTYTIDKAQLKVSVKRSDIYAQYGEEISNPVTFTNASTGQEIASDASDYTALSQAITYGMEPQGGLTQVEGSENAEGKFTVAVTQQMVTVTVNVAATENYEAATEITYHIHASASGSLDVSLPFADLTYNGQPQQLLAQAPELPNGVYIHYKVGESGEWTAYSDKNQDNWKEVVGENAGSYTVYWETTSSGNYNASSGNSNTSIAKANLEGTFEYPTYPHVLATGGNSYDSAQVNPLDLSANPNYTGKADAYTYRSNDTGVAIAVNGGSTIRVLGSAGDTADITVTVPGDNNYNEGTFTYRLEISDDLSKIVYSVGDQEVTYNGQPQTIAVNVTAPASGATVMYQDEDGNYTLSEPPAYTDVKEGGYPIKFQITAPGYEAVTDEATLKIEPKDISQCKVEGIAESYTYVGHQIVPETVAVVDGSVILTKDTDYTLEYGANQEVGEGEGSVIIKGTGNYTGEVTVYFNIAPVDGSSGMTASIDPAYGTYDPDGNTATVTVTHQTGTDSHEVTLTAENASYTITATDLVTGDPITERGATGTGNTLTFTKPAIYDITLKLTGDHQGEFHLSYTLLPLSNEDGGLTLTVDDETQKVFTYGGEIDPSDATIKVTANNTDVTDQCTLTYVYTPFEGTPTTTASPYTAEVLKNAGVYTVTATPTDGSAITGTGTFTFLILQRDLSKATLAVEDDNLVYNQAAQEPDVTVTVDGNAQPTEDADYTVTYYNNVNASKEAKAVVTAKGNNFTGSNTENFSIAPKEITDEMVKEIPEQYYTGNAVIPPVTITDGNYTLILGYDYTTACDAIGPGTATVTIEGKGNYTETTTKDFVIKSEGAPEPSERFDLVVTPSQWIWKDDLTNLRLSVTFGTGNELTLGKEYTLEVNGQTFDGTTGKTKDDALTYIKGLKPGEYTITATGVDAYKDSEDTETVTVKKIQPELTVTAAPGTLSGGGKVTLTLKGENLPDFAEGQDLSNLLAATAKDAKNNPDLSELEWETDEQTGVMTAELTLPNTNETYTFTLTFIETATHAGATDSEQVVVAQQIISGGGGGGPVEDQPANPDDTGVSDWLNTKDHLAYLAGYPGGTFGPDQNMTRAEAAQMFYNLLLEKDVEITVEFEDVPADAWYAKPVNTLASLGILSGVGNGRFDPERSITRAEFTVIAMKFANTSGGGVNIFSDVNEDDWFYSAVVDSTQYGWINGYPDGTFRPEATISRAEVTVIVNHMLGRAADRPYVIAHEEELNTFGDVNRGHWGYFHVAEATNAHEYHTEDGTESWTGLS